MRLIFVRLNEKNFFLFPGRSSGCGDERMINLLKSLLSLDIYPYERIDDYWEDRKNRDRFANEVVLFAKKNPEYIFWDIFSFIGGEFSYAAPKEMFFENKRQGSHLKETLEEMLRRGHRFNQ